MNQRLSDVFHRFATQTARLAGSAWAFIFAIASIAIWTATGPFFGFSNTWQLVVNTSTTIVTFLMVFLLQNTQNRESQATQIKLDEIIRALHGARNEIIDIEDLSDEQLQVLERQFAKRRLSAQQRGKDRH